MKTLTYIIGQPGAGKTTLMNEICKGASILYTADSPVVHRGMKGPHGLFSVLGKDRPPFGGTDTLSHAVAGNCEEWVEALSRCAAGGIVFGEGDRLASKRFLAAARVHYRVLLFCLEVDNATAAARRAARAEDHGLNQQSASWVKGRVTKHANLALSESAVRLDARLSPEDNAKLVWSEVDGKARATT
jgi:hypothetical protein